jgi:spore coat polysaccharide biosynthesis protein SpsF
MYQSVHRDDRERQDRRVLAIVQARTSSTRLPGKVLADLCGEPMLALLLRRLRRAQRVGEIVVATSVEADDDAIAQLAEKLGVGVSRGPLDDVLGRFVGAIGEHEGPVVRITGDCPLVDPAIVDEVIERFESRPGCAYASNVEPRTFPDGLDVEVIDAAVLRALADEQLSAEEREHVTAVLRTNLKRFRKAALAHTPDLGMFRWTVDEQADLEFMRALVLRLAGRRHEAGLEEILRLVRVAPSLVEFHGRRG